MKILTTLALAISFVSVAMGATVKISDLPLSTSPSTNSFIEVSDLNAGTKSVKYLLTNLVTEATLTANYVLKSDIVSAKASLAAPTEANIVDMAVPSTTNTVSGAVTINHATNGLASFEMSHVRWYYNGSGSDQTLTLPATWKTNVFSAVPTKLTNSSITVMYVKSTGNTLAQTNVYVSFEFYK